MTDELYVLMMMTAQEEGKDFLQCNAGQDINTIDQHLRTETSGVYVPQGWTGHILTWY